MAVRGLRHNYTFPALEFEAIGKQSPSTNPFSRYRRLRLVSYNAIPTLATFYPPGFPETDTDLTREALSQHQSRADLLAKDNYVQTDEIWWVPMLSNGVMDPFREVQPGDDFRLPSFQRITTRLVG